MHAIILKTDNKIVEIVKNKFVHARPYDVLTVSGVLDAFVKLTLL
jgi:hypothetical protein